MKKLGTYNSVMIKADDKTDMFSLTDMWKANGKKNGNKPAMWLRNKETVELIETLDKMDRVVNSQLVKIQRGGRGGGGGTWAYKDLAIAYAEYLSPKFHLWCIAKVKLYVHEIIHPEEGIKRNVKNAVRKYHNKGYDDKWITDRLLGITNRHLLTYQLGRVRNTNRHIFGLVTDDMNLMLLGQRSSDIKRKFKTKSTRDALNSEQLMIIAIGEKLAADALKAKPVECISAGEAIDTALDAIYQLSLAAEPFKIK